MTPGHRPLPVRRSLATFVPAIIPAVLLTSCAPSSPFAVDVPLRVIATAPSGASVGVSRDVEPRVFFSEAVSPPPSDAFKLLAVAADETTTPLAIDLSSETRDDGAHVVTVSPRIRLAPGTRHRLIVENTVRRARDGARLPTRVSFDFTTETPPPLDVVEVSPGHGAEGLSPSQRISVLFSEPPRCPLEGVSLVEVTDPVAQPNASPRAVAGTWMCTAPTGSADGEAACSRNDGEQGDDPCRVTFVDAVTGGQPVFGLGSEVRLTLPGADADEGTPVLRSRRAVGRGGLLRRTVSAVFSIAHPPPLHLERTSPSDGAVGISPSTPVTLWFSEPPRCGDVLANGVTVIESLDAGFGGGERVVPGQWTCPPPLNAGESCDASPMRCAVRFTAASSGEPPFRTSSHVRVELRGGDAAHALHSSRATVAGGWLPTSRSIAFRIQDPPPLLVLESTPRNGDGDVPADSELVLRFNQSVIHASVIPCDVDEASETSETSPADCNALLQRVDVTPEVTIPLTSLCVSEEACAPDVVKLAPVSSLVPDASYRLTLQRIGDAPRAAVGDGVLMAPFESVFRMEVEPGE